MKEVYIPRNKMNVGKRFFLIPGYDGYIISDDGELRTYDKNTKKAGRMIPFKFAKNKDMQNYIGYPSSYRCGYMLDRDGTLEYVPIPQLFNLAFCEGVADVIYIDMDSNIYYPHKRNIAQRRRYLNKTYNIKRSYALTWNQYIRMISSKCGADKEPFSIEDKKITLPYQYFDRKKIVEKYYGMKTRCTNINALLPTFAIEYLGASFNSDIDTLPKFESAIIPLYEEYRPYLESGAIRVNDLELDKDLLTHNQDRREYGKDTISLLPRELNMTYQNKLSNLPYAINITDTGFFRVPIRRNGKKGTEQYGTYIEALKVGRENRARQLRSVADKYKDKIPNRLIDKIMEDAAVVEAGGDKETEGYIDGKLPIKNFKLAKFLAAHNVTPISIRDKRYKVLDAIRISKELYSAAKEKAKEQGFNKLSDWVVFLIKKETGVEPQRLQNPTEKDIVVEFANTDTERICNLVQQWRESKDD